MSEPQPPKPAKLVIGLFLKHRSILKPVAKELADRFGPVDMVSPWFPFDFTHYYESEMGRPLYRRVLTFKNLIGQDELAGIKVFTNGIEMKLVATNRRKVNIDPGYLLLERFVLATGKNFTHRIYIGQGIYADLTLIFQKGRYNKLPWTYPDYAQGPLNDYLLDIRKKYTEDLRQGT